jgi:hypothetical protein
MLVIDGDYPHACLCLPCSVGEDSGTGMMPLREAREGGWWELVRESAGGEVEERRAIRSSS